MQRLIPKFTTQQLQCLPQPSWPDRTSLQSLVGDNFKLMLSHHEGMLHELVWWCDRSHIAKVLQSYDSAQWHLVPDLTYNSDFLALELYPSESERENIEAMVKDLMESSDLFRTDHSGYWLQGTYHGSESDQPGLGWLTWDMNNMSKENPGHQPAIDAFLKDVRLPDFYYRIDRQVATQIVHIGIAQHGIGFVDGACDASEVDDAVQMALLGEIQYG